MNFPVKNNMASAETYDKCLEIVREQFRIIESMSAGNRASWYQEVEEINGVRAQFSLILETIGI